MPTPYDLQFRKKLLVVSTAWAVLSENGFFQVQWLITFIWLVLCKTTKRAYCQICRFAVHSNLVSKSTVGYRQDKFFGEGYTDWKYALRSMQIHEKSAFHRAVHEKALKVLRWQSLTSFQFKVQKRKIVE